MLSDRNIKQRLIASEPSLVIDGYNPLHLNPASYDLTLSPAIRVVQRWPNQEPLDVSFVQPFYTQPMTMEGGYVLQPGEFILAATNEVVHLPVDLSARVEGKSSLGRIGLAVHITAGFIDPGFIGSITLEMVNLLGRPIRLRPHMRIAQIAFMSMLSTPERAYGDVGHYQGQGMGTVSEPQESKFRM